MRPAASWGIVTMLSAAPALAAPLVLPGGEVAGVRAASMKVVATERADGDFDAEVSLALVNESPTTASFTIDASGLRAPSAEVAGEATAGGGRVPVSMEPGEALVVRVTGRVTPDALDWVPEAEAGWLGRTRGAVLQPARRLALRHPESSGFRDVPVSARIVLLEDAPLSSRLARPPARLSSREASWEGVQVPRGALALTWLALPSAGLPRTRDEAAALVTELRASGVTAADVTSLRDAVAAQADEPGAAAAAGSLGALADELRSGEAAAARDASERLAREDAARRDEERRQLAQREEAERRARQEAERIAADQAREDEAAREREDAAERERETAAARAGREPAPPAPAPSQQAQVTERDERERREREAAAETARLREEREAAQTRRLREEAEARQARGQERRADEQAERATQEERDEQRLLREQAERAEREASAQRETAERERTERLQREIAERDERQRVAAEAAQRQSAEREQREREAQERARIDAARLGESARREQAGDVAADAAAEREARERAALDAGASREEAARIAQAEERERERVRADAQRQRQEAAQVGYEAELRRRLDLAAQQAEERDRRESLARASAAPERIPWLRDAEQARAFVGRERARGLSRDRIEEAIALIRARLGEPFTYEARWRERFSSESWYAPRQEMLPASQGEIAALDILDQALQ